MPLRLASLFTKGNINGKWKNVMKNILSVSALLLFSSISFASTFTCYRYVSNQPTGTWIKIKADSKSEAESKAYARMKELGGKISFAKCK